MAMNAYRDDLSSLNDRLAALSAEIASTPAIAPLHRALLSPDKHRQLDALEVRLREALAAMPTMLTIEALQHDVAELRELVGRIDEDLRVTRSRPWPIPEPEPPQATLKLGHSIDRFDHWRPQLEGAYRFGRAVRSDFERRGIPLVLVAFAHGSLFGLADQRMKGLLCAGVPRSLRVAALPRRTQADYAERARRPEVVVDPEFDAHFMVRGDRAVAPALFGPIREPLLAGKDWIHTFSLDGGAASLRWETVLVRDASILPNWALAAVTGAIETARSA